MVVCDMVACAVVACDMVVCAGAPAKKWLANKEPEADAKRIDSLIDCLRAIQADKFVLVSTVDVFKNPVCVDETSAMETEGLHPYGYNRWRLGICSGGRPFGYPCS